MTNASAQERAVEARRLLERARTKLGYVSIDQMGGDNLAVTLCSRFDDADGEQDENGWTEAATSGCDETLSEIHDLYVEVLAAALTPPDDITYAGADVESGEGHVLIPREPTEAMWGGLARDLMMWLDFGPHERTPRALFKHLERCGRDIPQWLRDEPEMKRLDHVPSKGTRAVLIYRAMVADAPAEEHPHDQR